MMVKKINIFLNKSQRYQYILLFVGSLIGALLELIGIGSIPIFIDFLINDNEKRLFNINFDKVIFLNFDENNKIFFLSLILSLIFIFKNIYFSFLYFYQGNFFKKIKIKNSLRLYNQYVQLPYEIHLNMNPALINRNLTSEVIVSTNYLENFLMIIRETVIISLIILLLLIINTYISLISVLSISFFSTIFYFMFKKIIKKLAFQTQNFRAGQVKNINQVFGSIKESKILNADNMFKKEFENLTNTIEKNNFYINFIQKLPKLIIEVLVIISLTSIITFFFVEGKQIINYLPIISLFAVGSIRLIPSFNFITSNLTRLKSESISFNYIVEELKKDKYVLTETKLESPQFKNFNDQIVLKNVFFKYKDKKEYILENINLKIKKGQMIGLIGESGQGKTTLINLLIGLLNPTSGQILFDNNDIKTNVANWRSLISFIPQDIYLLDDTIVKNIAFGVSEEKIDKNKIYESIKKSELTKFIKKLPKALDTIVGDRGVRISGGQRQRIGIARALYRNPEILILDEATSSLDIETENRFINNINKFKGLKTIIISTHKFEILKECDIIYKVQNKSILKNRII